MSPVTLPESIGALHDAWTRGERSFEALYQALDERIVADERLNIWLARTPSEQVLAQARQLDGIALSDRRDAIRERPLLGVPAGIKDNICTRELPTTAASHILEGHVSAVAATAVTRLEHAGAIVLGKTNMDEFGMGSSGAFSAFGATRNPVDPARVPGGSSSGSAAALAASHCMIALGSDTGGSVRQPASHCGVWGSKPTYGSVSRHGLIAHASSLEQVGPMARDSRDLAALYRVIEGHDPRDATSSPTHRERVSRGRGARLRLGVLNHWRSEEVCSPAIWEVLEAWLDLLLASGAVELVPCDGTWIEHASAVYAVLSAAEASSNLARYDGVRFGLRAGSSESPAEMMRASRTEGFGEEVKRRILLGSYVLCADAFESHMMQAQRVRALIARELDEALSCCDVLFAPTAPTPAPLLDAKPGSMTDRFLDDALTVPANLSGLPAICFPCTELDGLPVGAQLIGPRGTDFDLIELARHLLDRSREVNS